MENKRFLYPNDPISFNIDRRKFQRLTKIGRRKLARGEAPAPEDWKEKEFGERYSGTFVLRVPTLSDQAEIAKLVAVRMSSKGQLDQTLLSPDIRQMEYAFALVETCAEEAVPNWFNKDKLWSTEDMVAVQEVVIAFNEQLNTIKKKLDET